MCRIILANGYQTSAIDVDQEFQEVRDRIEKSKNGFIFLTQEGSGRYFNTQIIGYVVDHKPIPIDGQEPIDHTKIDEVSEDTGSLHTAQTPISPIDLPAISV